MQLEGKNLANPTQLVCCVLYTWSHFKILVGKILAESAKIFHHQNFALYGSLFILNIYNETYEHGNAYFAKIISFKCLVKNKMSKIIHWHLCMLEKPSPWHPFTRLLPSLCPESLTRSSLRFSLCVLYKELPSIKNIFTRASFFLFL